MTKNNKVVYNEMVVRTLCEYFASDSPNSRKLNIPLPEVFLSAGAQYVVDFFEAKEIIVEIGRALVCDISRNEELANKTRLTWRFNSDELSDKGDLKAYPMETFSKEDYQDDFHEDDLALYVTRVATADFPELDKLILCSYWSGNDYVICLPTEFARDPSGLLDMLAPQKSEEKAF